MASGRHSVGGVSGVTATRPAAAGAWQQTRPTRAEARRAARAAGTSGPFAFAGLAAVAVAAGGGVLLPGASGVAMDDAGNDLSMDRVSPDAQFSSVRASAEEMAQRASREQSRLDADAKAKAREIERKRREAIEEAKRPKFSLPILGPFVISSYFGAHDIARPSGGHKGVDFACPTGTPIRAVADGRAVAGWDHTGLGKNVTVYHEDGTRSRYGHMSAFKVRNGYVKAGDIIGYVGSTGYATGPHLHM